MTVYFRCASPLALSKRCTGRRTLYPGRSARARGLPASAALDRILESTTRREDTMPVAMGDEFSAPECAPTATLRAVRFGGGNVPCLPLSWRLLLRRVRQMPLTTYGIRVMVVQVAATLSTAEALMALRFLGIWPNTPSDQSPTIWQDEATGDLIIQSWKADEATVKEAQFVGSVPGHTTDIPEYETVIRLPANMLQFIPRPDGETGRGNTGT